MVDFPGYGPATLEAFERPYEQDSIRTRRNTVSDPEGLLDPQAFFPGAGTYGQYLPADPTSTQNTPVGYRGNSFFDDYYNQVFFLPGAVDFGAVSSDVQDEVLVWNAHLHVTTLTNVTEINPAGVTLVGPGPPYAQLPLQITSYLVQTGTEGAPSIDTDFVFTFDTPEVFSLKVTGTRARFLPTPPNWGQNYQTTITFKTDTFTSRDGSEQRRALRTTARKRVEFTSQATFSVMRELNALLSSWQDNNFVVPEAYRSVTTAVTAGIGTTTMELTEAPPYWLNTGSRLLFAAGTVKETRRVASVAGAVVTFSEVAVNVWPAGSIGFNALSGLLDVRIRQRQLTDEVSETRMVMDVTPGSEPDVPLPAPDETFKSVELFTTSPNWGSPINLDFLGAREMVDFQRGLIAEFRPVPFNNRLTRLVYTFNNRASAEKVIAHFRRMRGEQGEFYMPTWNYDIEIAYLSPAASQTLRIHGTDFVSAYGGSTVFKALAVYLFDGSIYYNGVEDIYEVDDLQGNDSVIQCDTPWPVDIDPQNVKKISWVLVWRHATDKLTVTWLTDSVAQCQLTVQSLEDLTDNGGGP